MSLIHFYREQFLELSAQFEPVWEEELFYNFGYRWFSHTHSGIKESFQMSGGKREALHVMYAIELPNWYKRTNLCDEIKNIKSPYEVSLYMLMDKILITSSASFEHLQITSLGFVNQARAEIIDLVFSAIEKVECGTR
ncbi:hypothetical protein [Paenibacillus ferrarius]|uniref:hypothetical protein n=1 Tax=Paenibacillus ferrarius TaxID=1469647 RepID=UPI003D292450